MAVTKKHTLSAVVFDTTVLGAITRQSIAQESEIRGDRTSGEVWARWQALYKQRVAPSFATRDLATALAEAGLTGVSIADLTAGFIMYAQKYALGGTRTAGAAHRKFVLDNGLIVPRRLSVSHGEDAELEYEIFATSDGTNHPLTITDTQSLPAGIDDAARFTLPAAGNTTIGAKTINQVQSIEIDFGVSAITEGADSDLWDTFCGIEEVAPSLVITTTDVETLGPTQIPREGLVCTHANTFLYLRKRDDGGTFVADVTAEHIKLTAAGLAVIDEMLSDDGQTALRIPLIYDGTNAPLTINPASAIT